MPAPNGDFLLMVVVLVVIAAIAWLFVRSAARSGTRGSARRDATAAQKREARLWEQSQRDQPR
jgi:flagellar biosynthesis/type III secretory pathway M-ring protein FliF/YscJ